MPDGFVTIDEAAKLLGCSSAKISAMIKRGDIRGTHLMVDMRRVFIPLKDIETILAKDQQVIDHFTGSEGDN